MIATEKSGWHVVACVSRWNEYLELLPEIARDIYFKEEYVKLYESDEDKAECFVYKEGGKIFLFPYIKRLVPGIGGMYYDAESSYGYSGPLSNTADSSFINRAIYELSNMLIGKNIIALFVRFHPILENHRLFEKHYDVFCERNIVVMDLAMTPQRIWEESIHQKHRNVIVKAKRSGLVYRVDEALEAIDVFKEMYRARMKTLNVHDFYIFNDAYFKKIKRTLTAGSFFGLVYFGDCLIAGALFFKHGEYGHYHLAASDERYNNLSPNNFLIFQTALYMQENGVKSFNLGGGTDKSEKNGVFKFKQRFSKDTRPFYTSKIIIDNKRYEEACLSWEGRVSADTKNKYGNLLLKYRY